MSESCATFNGHAFGLFRIAELIASHPDVLAVFPNGVVPIGYVETRKQLDKLLATVDAGGVSISFDDQSQSFRLHFSENIVVPVYAPEPIIRDMRHTWNQVVAA